MYEYQIFFLQIFFSPILCLTMAGMLSK